MPITDLSVHDLKRLLDEGREEFELVDVRTQGELDLAKIESSRLLDAGYASAIDAMPRDRALVFI